MITLHDVYDGERERHVHLLYELLKERPVTSNISHAELPTFVEHRRFVERRPYREWLMVEGAVGIVGALYASNQNEIGIAILREHHRGGYAEMALWQFTTTRKPLPALPGVRLGRWIANIAPANEASKQLFQKLGFRKLQETYAL